ncbi:MAG: ribosome recycling factor [Phycisphaerales bacterium]|nr:ribosome recycling factor [Phycisphaerales bacterium]
MSHTSPDEILLETEEHMTKALDYLKKELKGMRTGRASTALVEFIKVDYYGEMQDMKNIAAISVPEPTQLLVKPFDPSAMSAIKKAIESSGLGLNPMAEGKQFRLNLPPLSGDRRKQLVGHCKKMAEETKVALRNARRDGNKHSEALEKNPAVKLSEDGIKTLKEEVQELLKKYEKETDDLVAKKSKEIEEV